jgi:catechol 2,3-dioxygenase
MGKRIDPRVDIGHVHLKVADLDRAVAFYSGVLGFDVITRWPGAAFLSAGGYHHHIGLNTWESAGGSPPPPGTTGLYHVAIRYPDRAALGEALQRLTENRVRLEGASDHGVSEALYLRDPDGNGIELYWDRPREEWPRAADGSIEMISAPLDLGALRAAAEQRAGADRERPVASSLSEGMRTHLRDLRTRLLNLHKVLLDDARAAYEMDRGRISSNANLLQLVINDPWFAWLHPLSELVVRIDETIEPDSPATEADGAALVDQVEHLLAPAENGETFARRYFEALQRQPSVVLAHADVRRALKTMR